MTTARLSFLLALLASRAAGAASAGAPTALTTVAEQSGYQRTGRYDEVIRLCEAFPSSFPGRARCHRFGQTPEGRPMLALIASADGVLDAQAARARRRKVVLFQGGIHAGEIDGKDAGLPLLRELLAAPGRSPVLGAATVVFVPVYNVDGHERFGRNNRPNQLGPDEMGWRVTSQNLNLNRDYVKAEAPETAAMLRLLAEWDPILYVDLHVTDGADFQPDVAVMVEPRLTGPQPLRTVAQSISDTLMQRLEALRHRPLSFYPSFVTEGDPESGFAVGMPPPRFQNGYWPQRNRLGVLVETHSWKDFKTRVRATADVMRTLLELVRSDGDTWVAAAAQADAEAERLGGSEVPLVFDNTEHKAKLRFPGYAYRVEPSAISGALRVRYDPHRPEIWEVPFYDELKPVASALAPRAGFVVPAAHAGWVAEKLRLHGLVFSTIEREQELPVEAFRLTQKKFREAPFEGRQTVQVKGAWRREQRVVGRGSLYVPIAQPKARLLLHLLDPAGPDSLLAWGFFNAHLEQKEYMEPYVAEAVGEELLARDVALRTAFLRKLASDPAFARDPAARLRFIHEHHASWDERLDLYPIYKLDAPPR